MSDLVSPCDSIEPLLGDYADGEVVSAADKERIETHLKECASCTSDLAFFRATNFVISSRFPDVQPPIDVFLRTAQATYARPTLRARIAGWLAPTPVRLGLGSAFAAAVVLAVVVPLTQRQGNESVRPLAENEASKTPTGYSLKPLSISPDRGTRRVAVNALKPTATLDNRANATAAHASRPLAEIAEHVPADLGDRVPTSTHAPVRPVTQVAVNAVPAVAPAPARDFPTIVQKIKATRLIIPVRRDVDTLARRGGMPERTLPNGDLPREFVAPKLTVPIAVVESPARETSVVASAVTGNSGTEPSSARSVGEPAVRPHGALHISLGGAGGRVAFAAIQLKSNHNNSLDSYALVSAPMDDKSDDSQSQKKAAPVKVIHSGPLSPNDPLAALTDDK